MKKNTNILNYLEKYKEKYGIKYAAEGGKLVKTLSRLTACSWVYSFFMMMLSIISFALNFKAGILNYTDFSNVFVTTVVCAVCMIVAAVLFVCRQKIIGSAFAVAVQPFIVLAYELPSRYGMSYLPSFYWKFVIPAVLLCVFAIWLVAVLLRAEFKTNKLYNTLLDGIYKQHGTRDGEKLTDQEWQEFLDNYNPYN